MSNKRILAVRAYISGGGDEESVHFLKFACLQEEKIGGFINGKEKVCISFVDIHDGYVILKRNGFSRRKNRKYKGHC